MSKKKPAPEKKVASKKAVPKAEVMGSITMSSFFQQSPEEKARITAIDKERRHRLETALKRQLDFFIANETENEKPESILFDLFCHRKDNPSDGIFEAEIFTESLIKFLMIPEHMTAFQAINNGMTAEQIGAHLVQMSWAFRELQKDRSIAIFDKMNIARLGFKQAINLLQHYSEKNIVAANAHIAKIIINEKLF